MLKIGFYCLIATGIFTVLGSFSLLQPASSAITRTGITGVQAQLVDSNLVVWGISTKDKSFQVDVYDPGLGVKFTYTKLIPGFSANNSALTYCGDSYIEFLLRDDRAKKHVFVRLNKRLEEQYVSVPFILIENKATDTLIKITPLHVTSSLSNYRNDNTEWEIKSETVKKSRDHSRVITTLCMNKEKNVNNIPIFEQKWRYVIDSSSVEYAKVFLSQQGRVYAYVNFSIGKGGQYIYCFDDDGTLIYKTKLVVAFNDIMRNSEYWDVPNFAESAACIFSNYLWDVKTNRLMIGGTWLGDSLRKSGLFLVQLNEAGAISGSISDYAYWMSMPTTGKGHSGDGAFSRNSCTYYRIKSMGYQTEGTFTVIAESYARISLWDVGKTNAFLQDSFHHYYSVESYWFNVAAGSIKPKCGECVLRAIPWSANHHLDSIAGFVPGKTKMDDELYINDVNRICDPDAFTGHYVAGFRDREKNGFKILTQDSVQVGSTMSNCYFTKTQYGLPNGNCIPFLSPFPVHEQNFAQPTEYYASSSRNLFRLLKNSNGYVLSGVEW